MPSVIGWSAFYDYRRTAHEHGVHQLGLGAELLTDWFEFRANAYLPNIGHHRNPIQNAFVGNTFNFNRQEVAMPGFDVEAGVVLPPLGPVQTKVFGGGYVFDDSGTPAASGWKARVEAAVNESLTTGVSVQRDDVFGSTVLASVMLRSLWEVASGNRNYTYPSIDSYRRGEDSHITRSARDRLADPVQRLPFVVTGIDNGDAATNPASNMAFTFLHVAPGAVGGDGSINRPVGSFTAAMADARSANAIVYTPYGGTFTENFTTTAGSATWSNAVAHQLGAVEGNFAVPFSGVGQSSTQAARLIGDITLASNTEVDGLNITGRMQGNAVSNVLLERNRITAAGGDGISLTNLSTTAVTPLVIQDNVITGAENGIRLVGATTAPLTGNVDINAMIVRNTLTGPGSAGVGIGIESTASRTEGTDTVFVGRFRGVTTSTGSTPTTNGGISDNQVSGYRAGIRVHAGAINGPTSSDLLPVVNNTASNNLLGIELGSLSLESDIAASITGNTANATQLGLHVAGNSFRGTIGTTASGNTFNNTTAGAVGTGQGILVELEQVGALNSNPGQFRGDIINNTVNQNAGDGLSVRAFSLAGNVTNNTANQNGATGILLNVDLINSQTPDSAVSNNTANNNVGSGIAMIGPGVGLITSVEPPPTPRSEVGGLIQTNTTNNNTLNGLVIQGYDDVTATIGRSGTATTGGNTATGNQAQGIQISSIDTFSGAFNGNTASNNRSDGIVLESITFITAAVTNNTASNNGDNNPLVNRHGLLIGPFGQLTGEVSNNIANSNDGSGIFIRGDAWGLLGSTVPPPADPVAAMTLFQTNTTSTNRDYGLFTRVGVLNASLTGNTAEDNGLEGVRLVVGQGVTPTFSPTSNPSSILITTTTLARNNLTGSAVNPNREFVLDNNGNGTVFVQFGGNTSTNQVSLNPADNDFNFDVLNTGLGVVEPESLSPTQRNTGTPGRIFGSSDLSVLFTFQD